MTAQPTLFQDTTGAMVTATAVLSDCGRYRYNLTRQWGPGPEVVYVMLNPSTANAHADDHTIRKCRGFAERLGAGSLRVVNLFAWRATDPRGLRDPDDPVGPDNDQWLEDTMRGARAARSLVIAAWGAHPQPSRARRLERAEVVRAAAARARVPLRALAVSKTGDPGHPLMLSYTSRPTPWPLEAP